MSKVIDENFKPIVIGKYKRSPIGYLIYAVKGNKAFYREYKTYNGMMNAFNRIKKQEKKCTLYRCDIKAKIKL